jgi:hypothetical protein
MDIHGQWFFVIYVEGLRLPTKIAIQVKDSCNFLPECQGSDHQASGDSKAILIGLKGK